MKIFTQKKEKMTSGFLFIDKPEGWTSFDVVNHLRRVTKIKKIGHAGTLDPFATGLLIIAVGKQATKQIDKFKNLNKTYKASIKLGIETDTYDKTGKTTNTVIPAKKPTKKEVKKMLENFLGEQKQTPPMFSAKKMKGKRLYKLARKGIEVERKQIHINIYNIKLIKYRYPNLVIETTVSSGTYIRTLAFDIGKRLNTGAYCQKLKRISINDFSIRGAKKPKKLNKKNWQKYIKDIFKIKNN